MTFGVLLPVIHQACVTWDGQAECLRAGERRLQDARGAADSLGPRVSGAAQAYLATWCAEVSGLADQAQARSDGLARFAVGVVWADQAAADAVRSVLPWDDRLTVLELPGGGAAGS
ncbi:hypothetical protein ASD11_14775 [Aeromicrobium sp. Root495]|uniref:hypothetical protein n=1 Tax=Aeromicrobium sp. Root495 TaxID=1736550 RepID=UPI0006FAC1E1|nr:hypothetical protein [Aeromicrobium sp. Root495]KQY55769.1 hypothetical protein ASD11_14775 [Aeromicrobium sp. Root495]RYJ07328.1 MAG: hypothetical protein EON52_01835 [Actinomycetales bacterium]